MPGLKKELGLFQVTVAGVGVILGAGVYALLGLASATAGNAIWLSFLIGAIVAILTGLSYAELSSMFKGDAGEYDYIKSAIIFLLNETKTCLRIYPFLKKCLEKNISLFLRSRPRYNILDEIPSDINHFSAFSSN